MNSFFYPRLFLLSILLLSSFGCGESRAVLVVCPEEHCSILTREAELFTLLYKNREVFVHPLTADHSVETLESIRDKSSVLYFQQEQGLDADKQSAIRAIPELYLFDLYLCDSETERNELYALRCVTREERIGCLSPVILISESLAKEKEIHSLESLLRSRATLGIVGQSHCGVGEISVELLARFPAEQWEGNVSEWRSSRELLLALEAEKIDAVLVWENIARAAITWHAQRISKKTDSENSEEDETAMTLISLPPFPNEPIVVPLVMLTLSESHEPKGGQLFVRFLRAPKTIERLAELGWGRP